MSQVPFSGLPYLRTFGAYGVEPILKESITNEELVGRRLHLDGSILVYATAVLARAYLVSTATSILQLWWRQVR